MPASIVEEFWRTQFATEPYRGGGFALTANPTLEEDRRAMLLVAADGTETAVVSPALAGVTATDAASFRAASAEAGARLHDPDLVHYLAADDRIGEETGHDIRLLTSADEDAFAAFEAGASEQDLDDAYVELDHWAVVGAFDGDELVCAASAYPWDDTQLADLGVLTLESHRGRGIARRVVRALAGEIIARGYEPQYRCQVDNAASIALARRAGFEVYGTWEPVSPDQ
ncbi:GNAT family N-acetyltransferase [Microbacterium sp. ASV49]|uniref:GNAT family N-acetyltransferase n=1 Tax=Microbacterium candidum TaxID=3041922 RepID=A0ABT7N1M5_9MICO|nr:GNAT family N-acetyltransferase [Microbacterium sp. ASV49]MDL9980609.1 GNAT family N-acetyltransferase [Microbacterium sp. ASV49]